MTTFKSDDDRNPMFALQTISTEILAAAVRGDIDLNALAKKELANRSLDFNGKWVGFERAKELSNMSVVRRADGKTALVSVPEN